MPWKTINLDEWAKELDININELRQKDRLIDLIIKTRKQLDLTQAQLAKLVGVSQPRIAQIENRVRIGKITFFLELLGSTLRATVSRNHGSLFDLPLTGFCFWPTVAWNREIALLG